MYLADAVENHIDAVASGQVTDRPGQIGGILQQHFVGSAAACDRQFGL